MNYKVIESIQHAFLRCVSYIDKLHVIRKKLQLRMYQRERFESTKKLVVICILPATSFLTMGLARPRRTKVPKINNNKTQNLSS